MPTSSPRNTASELSLSSSIELNHLPITVDENRNTTINHYATQNGQHLFHQIISYLSTWGNSPANDTEGRQDFYPSSSSGNSTASTSYTSRISNQSYTTESAWSQASLEGHPSTPRQHFSSTIHSLSNLISSDQNRRTQFAEEEQQNISGYKNLLQNFHPDYFSINRSSTQLQPFQFISPSSSSSESSFSDEDKNSNSSLHTFR